MNRYVCVMGPIFILLGFFAFTGCQSPSSEAAKATQIEVVTPSALTVQVTTPTLRTVQRIAQGQGALFAKESVILSNKRDGYVSTVRVDFGDKVKKRLLHQVVVMHEANQRQGTHCTKTKGEVSGSGKKPYRQKGTGLARAGNLRSPIRKGGSVAMGPRPRDYRQIITKQTRKAAINSAFLAKIQDNEVSVIEALDIPEVFNLIEVVLCS